MVSVGTAEVNDLLRCRDAFLKKSSIKCAVVSSVMFNFYAVGCCPFLEGMLILHGFDSTSADLIRDVNQFSTLINKYTLDVI